MVPWVKNFQYLDCEYILCQSSYTNIFEKLCGLPKIVACGYAHDEVIIYAVSNQYMLKKPFTAVVNIC